MSGVLDTIEGLLTPAKFYAGLAGAVVIVLGLGGLWFAGHHAGSVSRDKHWTPIVSALQADVTNWKAATDAWIKVAVRQNAAALATKAEADRRTAEAEKRVKLALRSKAKAEAQASKLVNAELRGTTLERYEQADQMVKEALQ